ncbi:sugar transferase [Mucilaginibacter koreensis]
MKYQFCIRFKNIDANSAASKAVIDCNRIFSALGYQDYTFTVGDNKQKLKYYCLLLKELLTFFFSVKKGSVVGIQYPLLSINNVFKRFIKVARLKGVKFFCVVHDLESLRTGGKDQALIHTEIENLNWYDILIVHNPAMRNWLQQHGVSRPMISLELFDYLSDGFEVSKSAGPADAIAFAGNLSKSTFIYNLGKLNTKRFNVYGPNFNQEKAAENVNLSWKGEYSPDKIPEMLQGSFGLIWDGNHIDVCDEILGNYLMYNNPHKCSLYIAAGLPVIAPANSAIGAYIKQHNIGILVDSLYDLDVLTIDDTLYTTMRNNVMTLRAKVIKGDYFAEAVRKAEKELC